MDFVEPPQEYHDSPVEVAFKESDPFYSNQGEAGTCVRHSVAKAIHAEALDKGKFPMTISSNLEQIQRSTFSIQVSS